MNRIFSAFFILILLTIFCFYCVDRANADESALRETLRKADPFGQWFADCRRCLRDSMWDEIRKGRGLEGHAAKYSFLIKSDCTISDVRLLESSGSKEIDRYCLCFTESVTKKFPKPPANFPYSQRLMIGYFANVTGINFSPENEALRRRKPQ